MTAPATEAFSYVKESKLIGLYRTAYKNVESYGESGIQIRLISNPDRLAEIYRFRYKIYVEEMHLPQYYADHARRSVKDPLDDGGFNFAAFDDEDIVGTLRLNFPRSSDVLYYEQFLDLASVGQFHPSATSVCTRLMVAPHLRGSILALRLAATSYHFALRHHIRFNFVDCNDHLVRFFARLGYTTHRRAEHPEYGMGTVMRLDLLDRANLLRMRSPFVAILDRHLGERDDALHGAANGRVSDWGYASA